MLLVHPHYQTVVRAASMSENVRNVRVSVVVSKRCLRFRAESRVRGGAWPALAAGEMWLYGFFPFLARTWYGPRTYEDIYFVYI